MHEAIWYQQPVSPDTNGTCRFQMPKEIPGCRSHRNHNFRSQWPAEGVTRWEAVPGWADACCPIHGARQPGERRRGASSLVRSPPTT